MRSAAARPVTVFTSIGKNVMMMTTAALDGQSKPNHITMIGATPMIGKRRHQVADGQQPAAQERHAVDQNGDQEGRSAADGVADQHGLEEGLLEIGFRECRAGGQVRRIQISEGARQRARLRHGKADDQQLPQDQQPDAEGQRDRQRRAAATPDRAARVPPFRSTLSQAIQPRSTTDQGPETGSRIARVPWR
jgi:hypothetical protein